MPLFHRLSLGLWYVDKHTVKIETKGNISVGAF